MALNTEEFYYSIQEQISNKKLSLEEATYLSSKLVEYLTNLLSNFTIIDSDKEKMSDIAELSSKAYKLNEVANNKRLEIEYLSRPKQYREPGSKEYGGTWVNMFTLPVGTEFYVCNGCWSGKIVLNEKGEKCIENSIGLVPMHSGDDNWLSVSIYEQKNKDNEIPY